MVTEEMPSADKVVDMLFNKFLHKLRIDGPSGTVLDNLPPDEIGDRYESEFRIVKLNQKNRSEIHTNKYDFTRPPVLVGIHIEHSQMTTTTAAPPVLTTVMNTLRPMMSTTLPTTSESSLLDILAISKFEHEGEDFLDDYNDSYGDNDYAIDVLQYKRRTKNAQATIKKFMHDSNSVSDPIGKVYTRWSKWTKCSAK